MEHLTDVRTLEEYRRRLTEEEKSQATISKYMHDVQVFFGYLGKERYINKEKIILYKEYLIKNYALTSANSMLAALNSFLKMLGWHDCIVKAIKIQRENFRATEKEMSKEEYFRLLDAARKKGKHRLYLLMQTICATGIRISELRYITVESLGTGRAQVRSKGKSRTILLPGELQVKLKKYVRENEIRKGSIFITRSGQAVDRSNVCREMKALCEEAGVEREKVFPHNLRHLFACTYYKLKKDITHLADILGHANINTTRIYTLVSGEEEIRQLDRMGLVIQE